MNTDTESRETPLAIVGLGCLFPQADGPGAYWANVKNAVDCITDVPATHWNPDDYFDPDPKSPDMTYARRGGFLDAVPFNPFEFGIAPRDIEATDTAQLLGLVAAKMALRDAGVSPDVAARTSVILGVTGTLELVIPLGARLGHPKWKRAMRDAGIPEDAIEDAAGRIAESYVPWQENSFPGLLGNVVAGRIANKLDLGGTNCVVDAACASSLSAVHLAALELQAGRCDVAVTGGVDTFNDIFMFMCFSKTPALSPTGDAKPFDAAGDGTILGEGLGMVVLKRLADAERDGDRVYAVLKGIGSSSDGKGNAIYAPSAAGQKKALQNAYRLAGLTPDTVELVEAHGTGTKVGDTVEITALADVYGEHANWLKHPEDTRKPHPWCAVGSVKSQIGHTKAAAGAASLIKATLALYHKVLPPTAKVTKPVDILTAPDASLYVNTSPRPWLPRAEHPRRAAVSAFGFGGSNFHAVLEEHHPAKPAPDWDGSVELWAASGDTPQSLADELGRVPTDTWPAFARLAEESRTRFDPAAPCRLLIVAHKTRTDLANVVAEARAKIAADPTATEWQVADAAFFGRGPTPGGLAVLFPGQGSQAVGMLRDVVTLFPETLDTLADANRTVAEQANDAPDSRRLSDRIYPQPAFTSADLGRQEATLKATDIAQPALGAVSMGLYRVLRERFGITPDAFAGHSYGELPALAAAGRLTVEEMFRLSWLRGRLMAEQRAGDPGGMLAVFAPLADIEAAIRADKLDLVVANKNAPGQSVLSGSTGQIDRAESAFADRGIRAVRLPVAAAFHSPLVADAAGPFRAALDDVAFPPGAVPVYANTSAGEYPADPEATRDLLGHQLANPVAFADEVRAMAAAGVRTFLEVGPRSVLTALATATLTDAGVANATAIAVDGSAGRRPGVLDLGIALARLAARGHAVQLAEWEADGWCRPGPEPKPGMTVPVSGANVVSPRPVRPARPPAPIPTTTTTQTPRTPVPVGTSVMPEPSAVPSPDPAALAPALKITQETLTALQRMQEQSAQLHRQFLETQEQAQRTLFALVHQQQGLLFPAGLPGAAPAVAPVPTAAVPVAAPVPAPPVPAAAPTVALPVTPRAAPTPAVVPTPVASAPPIPTAVPVAAPIAPPAAAAPTVAAPAGSAAAAVEGVLLEVVAEKTGYPVGMLDLGMALDADLGVDSIKRVEILSALQERLPDAPVVKPEHLGTLHTLRDVAAFLAAASPAPASPASAYRLAPAGSPDSKIDFDLPPIAPEPEDSLSYPDVPVDVGLAADPAGSAAAAVEGVLLEVVAEKTGYPVGMLDLGMALDADLGVDSIKRVEILSALQERLPDAPVVKPEHLGTLHTLRDVAAFLAAASPAPAPPATIHEDKATTPEPPPTAEPAPDPSPEDSPPIPGVEDDLILGGVMLGPETKKFPGLEPTSLGPNGSARPPLSMPFGEEPTPFGLVFPTTNLPLPFELADVDRNSLQVVDLEASRDRSSLSLPADGIVAVVGSGDPLAERVVASLQHRGLNAILFPWADPTGEPPVADLAGLVLVAPPTMPAGLNPNRLGFLWLKAAAESLRQATRRSGTPVFATVTRLDGAFGLGDLGTDVDPTVGGLAGLVKTAHHEWPEVACKAIDVAPQFVADAVDQAADAVADELLTVGPVEVGVSAKHRCALGLARSVGRPTDRQLVFGPKDIVLVTGGGRGVTAEAAVALAGPDRPTLILTGRTAPPPAVEPDWLRGRDGESTVKAAIAEHLGPTAGPKMVGELYARVIAQREIARTLGRIRHAGGTAVYLAADLTAGRQAADLLHQIQVKHGPVTGLVYGAGVLADRRIEDLTPEQFDRVYSTKVDGLRHLLDLLGGHDLRGIVLFSSTTARLGRTGQLAYAVANEVLNKTAQVESRKRPNSRVVAINWGPWDGGMVTPALKKVFETEGVGVIPLDQGGQFAVAELIAGGTAVEVIALGKPPKGGKTGSGLLSQALTVRNRTPIPAGLPASPTPAGVPVARPDLTPAFERTLDIATHPVLKSHVLDGRAVLPMALHMEWLAHAALHGNPGLVFHGFNDLRITHGVMIDGDARPTLTAMAGRAVKQADKLFHVPVELRGVRRDGKEAIHSRAEVVLTSALPAAPAAGPMPDIQPYPHPVDEVYRYFLFHGPDLYGIERVDGLSESAFVATAYPAPPPAEWFEHPLRGSWVADPLVIDASFQMMILWSFAQHGAGSLPCFTGRYRQYVRSFPAGPVRVVIRITRDNGSFARADIDFRSADGQVVARMQDYECVIDRQLDQAFRRNQLVTKARA